MYSNVSTKQLPIFDPNVKRDFLENFGGNPVIVYTPYSGVVKLAAGKLGGSCRRFMKIQLTHTFEEIIAIENLLDAWEEFIRDKGKKQDT